MRLLPLLASLLVAVAPASAFGPDATPESIRHMTSRSCGRCHRQIYKQWKKSMHAQSTALTDPIHGTFYRAVVGDPHAEGVEMKGKFPVCLQCHAPTAAKDGTTDLSSRSIYKEGVNCVSCHSLTRYKGIRKPEGGMRLGLAAYEYSDTTLQGSSGRLLGQTHPANQGGHPVPVEGNPGLMRSNGACMGCHDTRNNGHGVPLCQTGDEISSAGGAPVSCLSCHMPVVDGRADHSMMGGHSPRTVARGLRMELALEASPEAPSPLGVELRLTNRLPHNFPTGAPFRNVFVILTAHDASGKQLWTSSPAGHPLRDDRKAALFYALGDAEGNPAPPPKATQVLGDSRLKPGETRTLRYQVPREGVAYLEAVASYDLLLPPLKEKFAAQIPEELRESQEIARALVRVTGE